MRIALLTIGFALLLASRADAVCIGAIKFQDSWYRGGNVKLKLGAKLPQRAIVPACNDAGPEKPDTKTTAYRIPGVDPRVGVATRKGGWYNAHTFPYLREHPLHKRLGFDKARYSPYKGKSCTVTAKVTDTFGSFNIDHEPQRFVSMRPDTKITLRRYGVAWIEEGTTLRIRGGCGRDMIYATHIDKG
ncbi:DUF6281 family protein [Solirubrobacter phytolaccae]|uniref:DUF6281 family protein n=1 Tax=Solirubrobacter phytolaccae TaxID=1404360 RepID=A0A9X3NER4_9ACTN|nr:DUF6281 family protein [Solirubrobacter phytolaccae]MDA0183969.1 DUF6281 family protein [Solirubrobacter phytolaccae]